MMHWGLNFIFPRVDSSFELLIHLAAFNQRNFRCKIKLMYFVTIFVFFLAAQYLLFHCRTSEEPY